MFLMKVVILEDIETEHNNNFYQLANKLEETANEADFIEIEFQRQYTHCN